MNLLLALFLLIRLLPRIAWNNTPRWVRYIFEVPPRPISRSARFHRFIPIITSRGLALFVIYLGFVGAFRVIARGFLIIYYSFCRTNELISVSTYFGSQYPTSLFQYCWNQRYLLVLFCAFTVLLLVG